MGHSFFRLNQRWKYHNPLKQVARFRQDLKHFYFQVTRQAVHVLIDIEHRFPSLADLSIFFAATLFFLSAFFQIFQVHVETNQIKFAQHFLRVLRLQVDRQVI